MKALKAIRKTYQSRDSHFYDAVYPYLILMIVMVTLFIIVASFFLIYQLQHRPAPVFYAVNAKHEQRLLQAYEAPNMLSDTIVRFASKAAVTAYTFSFNEIENNLALARPYFTNAGWDSYRASVEGLINNVMTNQLFVNSIVYGVPVISNQGELPNKGYTWRVQIPFLVVYESANTSSTLKYYVVVTIVKVPPYINPRGIGIDQFVMTNG